MDAEAEGSVFLKAPGYTLPTQKTEYKDFCFTKSDLVAQGLPADGSAHIIGIEAILNNSNSNTNVHHILVYTGETEDGACDDEDSLMVRNVIRYKICRRNVRKKLFDYLKLYYVYYISCHRSLALNLGSTYGHLDKATSRRHHLQAFGLDPMEMEPSNRSVWSSTMTTQNSRTTLSTIPASASTTQHSSGRTILEYSNWQIQEYCCMVKRLATESRDTQSIVQEVVRKTSTKT